MSRLMIKPTKWPLHPAKTQISLGICPVWPESSLSAWRTIGSSATHWAQCEDSDQTGRMPRLIWVFTVRTCHFVGYVMRYIVGLQRFIALSHYNHLSIILIWMKWCWKENSPNHLSINHMQLDWSINYNRYKFWTIINILIYISEIACDIHFKYQSFWIFNV